MKLSPFTEHLVGQIQQKLNLPVIFRHITPEFGGNINEAFKLETSAGNFFIKRNDKNAYPKMFEAEARGLELIKKTNTITVPPVIGQGEFDNHQFLILPFISKGNAKSDFWENFGWSMAKLHLTTSENFGLDYDNYIGSLPQSNKSTTDWTDFFSHQRIEPQLATAVNSKKLNHTQYDLFQKLFVRIKNEFPIEKPALLHGDLWSGNFIANSDGNPVIFDPAVYFGHREMDLAMTMLFGGFHSKFYAAYNDVYPLEKNWKERTKIANLYPLLVHVNLFGGHYVNEVDSVLNHYK